MEYLFIYLLQLAHTREPFLLIFSILAVISVIVTIGTMMDCDHDCGKDHTEDCAGERIHKLAKKTLIISTILWLLVVFFPSERTLIMLGGVFLGKTVYSKVTTSEKMQKVNTLIDLQLDKLIKEYKEEVK